MSKEIQDRYQAYPSSQQYAQVATPVLVMNGYTDNNHKGGDDGDDYDDDDDVDDDVDKAYNNVDNNKDAEYADNFGKNELNEKNVNYKENNDNESINNFSCNSVEDDPAQIEDPNEDNHLRHQNTSGSVAISSITHSDGSLNLSNLPLGNDHQALLRLIRKLADQNMKLKTQAKVAKTEITYNPLVESTVRSVVKHDLFPKVQFIRHDELFDEFRNNMSIGKLAMDRCNIENNEKKRSDFWETYKVIVRKQVKIQRNIVHNALKKKFFGKYTKTILLIHIYNMSHLNILFCL